MALIEKTAAWNAATVQQRLDLAKGALGVAGHEISDAETTALMARVARGELTADEAVAQILAR